MEARIIEAIKNEDKKALKSLLKEVEGLIAQTEESYSYFGKCIERYAIVLTINPELKTPIKENQEDFNATQLNYLTRVRQALVQLLSTF